MRDDRKAEGAPAWLEKLIDKVPYQLLTLFPCADNADRSWENIQMQPSSSAALYLQRILRGSAQQQV